MADKSMKAVIRAEVDPSGVIKGVAATNRELAKLNSKTSAIAIGASFNMAQMGFQMLMGAFRVMDRRMSELAQMSTRFSPEAQRAVMTTKIRELGIERFMGEKFGVDVAGSERSKRAGMNRRAYSDAASGAGQISFFESLKQDAMSFGNDLLGAAAQGISDPEQFLKPSSFDERFKRLKGYMPFLEPGVLERGGRNGKVGVDWTAIGQMGQNMTRGMSDDRRRELEVENAFIDAENLRLMREQNRLLKGGS
jgi:hypothetical protein